MAKLTDAEKVEPGLAFGSCECVHCRRKVFCLRKSGSPFSPVRMLENWALRLPVYL